MYPKHISEKLLVERKERLEKAYQNKRPDRVPFSAPFPSIQWVAKYMGTSTYDICFNYDTMLKAFLRLMNDFNVDGVDSAPLFLPALDNALMIIAFVDYPDIASNLSLITGPLHTILRDRYTRWPGIELDINAEPQFRGGEFMKADEYRYLIEKPIEFLNETIIPRIFESLSNPKSPKAIGALIKAGIEIQKYTNVAIQMGIEATRMGWPSFPSIFGVKPLDYISDHLRHPTNIMVDLYRRPDDVKQAVEVIAELTIKFLRSAVPPLVNMASKLFGTSIAMVGYPLHLNEMLPPRLYNEFYWPTLRRVLIETINLGAIPFVFFEGDHSPHLETILELPKGKIYGLFERTDLRKVRRVLGDHIVIGGGISYNLFAFGSREKVYDEVCRLLNDVKEPGGFIFTGIGIALPPGAKIENIWAAVEAVKKCGVYP